MFDRNILTRKMVCQSIEWIRQQWPFSLRTSRGMFDTIPDLKNVDEGVKLYQRPRDFFNSEVYMRLHNRADYRGAPPQLRLFIWRYMRALRNRGLPFYVNNCWRSAAEQIKLKEGGFTALRSGAHQRSSAVDIVSAIDHWEVPEELWYYTGTLGEAVARDTFLGTGLDGKPLKIEWGGRWSKPDPAHWQLSDWKRRPLVREDLEAVRRLPFSDDMRFG